MELELRSSKVKFRAASNPCTLVTLRQQALKLVRLSKSCSVKGPLGFCKAKRMAAFRPGSGMDASCAWVEAMKLAHIKIARKPRMPSFFVIVLVFTVDERLIG